MNNITLCGTMLGTYLLLESLSEGQHAPQDLDSLFDLNTLTHVTEILFFSKTSDLMVIQFTFSL